MRNILRYALTGAALLSGMATAEAAPILGQISINGTDSYTDSSVLFTGAGNVGAGTATGSYSPTFSPGCNSCVTENGFTYNVLGAITPVQVYSAAFGGSIASFTINNIVSETNSGGFLNISATGFADLTNFAETAGTFLFTSQGGGGPIVTTFSATSNAVAEPLSLAVLGVGLIALGYTRRQAA